MFKIERKKKTAGQAAVELAVFGAILIFLIGTIVRSAAGNSYTQNQNFKAMRMAMLASWNGSKAGNTSHNNSSILFVEDRLSPDNSKYGDLDRNPYIAQGAGSFTYEMLYPLNTPADVISSLPVMDVYINGQHFPLTTASYVIHQPIVPPASTPACGSDNSCEANQCWRNWREWAGGSKGLKVKESVFKTPSVASADAITAANCLTQTPGAAQRECQEQYNACTIFNDLVTAGIFPSTTALVSCGAGDTDSAEAIVSPAVTSPLENSQEWATFSATNGSGLYETSFPNNASTTNNKYLQQTSKYLHAILTILKGEEYPYKLFYTLVANPGDGQTKSQFSTSPPTVPNASCTAHPCKNKELSSDVPLLDYNGQPTTDGIGSSTNSNGVMQYDLFRLANYSQSVTLPSGTTVQPISSQFPSPGCKDCQRNYIAWQWAATAGTSADMIGLVTANQSFPTYDIDGRLKEVTIYGISRTNGVTSVTYVDSQHGDVDETWDTNSCGPKPGLTGDSQILSFAKDGTYLLISEGKIYNPETGQVVRSANKRDSVDLIQRTIQLSNNTGRFCTIPCTDGSVCGSLVVDGRKYPGYCANGHICTTKGTTSHVCGSESDDSECANPNPVEACVDENPCTCSMGSTAQGPLNPACGYTLAETCYDTRMNKIFVRSRLEDRRGRFWMTNTSGQLKVK